VGGARGGISISEIYGCLGLVGVFPDVGVDEEGAREGVPRYGMCDWVGNVGVSPTVPPDMTYEDGWDKWEWRCLHMVWMGEDTSRVFTDV
jgi:hypothetical protein